MKTYAKLNEGGALQLMGRIPNISNPTEEQVVTYDAAHGYKDATIPQHPAGSSRRIAALPIPAGSKYKTGRRTVTVQ